MDGTAYLLAGVGIVIGLAVILALGYWPGMVAKRRGHPNATAIRICGLIGVLIWPAWIVALVWAYTGGSRGGGEPDYHYGTRPVARPGDVPPARSRRERR